VLLLNECLSLLFISLLTQSRNFWIHPCIRVDVGEIGWEGVDWMQLAQDRYELQALVNTVKNLQVP